MVERTSSSRPVAASADYGNDSIELPPLGTVKPATPGFSVSPRMPKAEAKTSQPPRIPNDVLHFSTFGPPDGGDFWTTALPAPESNTPSPMSVPMPADVPAPPEEPLLGAYLHAKTRDVDPQAYVASQILSRYANVTKPKRHSSRYKPAVMKRWQNARWEARHPDFAAIESAIRTDGPIGAIAAIDWFNRHLDAFDRTRVRDLALRAGYIPSLGRSEPEVERGYAMSRWAEGQHSGIGAAVRLSGQIGAYMVLLNVADPVTQAIGRMLLRQGIYLGIVPTLSGKVRSATDALEKTFLRVGGEPTIVKNVDKSPQMQTIFRGIGQAMPTLESALVALLAPLASARPTRDEVGHVVDASLKLAGVADAHYKERVASKLIAADGKNVGLAGVALQSIGNIASLAGQPLTGLAFAGAAVPVLALGGLIDEPAKQRAVDRNNLKHSAPTVMPAAVATKRFMDFAVADVSADRLRDLHMVQAEAKVKAVREVYTDAWGKLTRRIVDLDRKIAKGRGRLASRGDERIEIAALRAKLETEADAFESMDARRWHAIPDHSIVRECLDRPASLFFRQAWIRVFSPAERAQTLQRYLAIFGGAPVAAGVLLPAAEGWELAGSSHEPVADITADTTADTTAETIADHDAHVADYADFDVGEDTPLLADLNAHAGDDPSPAHHAETPLLGRVRAGAVAMGVAAMVQAGMVVAEVRKSKSIFKTRLSRPPIPPTVYDNDASDWTRTFHGHTMDARETRPYLLHRSTFMRRRLQVLAQFPEGIMTGPKGLYHQAKVHGLPGLEGARPKAHAQLRKALDALKQRGAKPIPGWNDGMPPLQDNITAIVFEMLSLDLVQDLFAHRARGADAATSAALPRGAPDAPDAPPAA